jgi:hydrogenase expression/formation protein HypE
MTIPANILLGHGGGGQLMDQLLDAVVRPQIGNEVLSEGLDSGIVDLQSADAQARLALTIDGYVVTPWKFPGGDIGRIAISGTVNDLAVCGAKPLGIALGLILAEGFETSALQEIMASIAATANEAGVKVITGDTKVVGRGQADGIYITTAGVGLSSFILHPSSFSCGDVLIINGYIADHGMAVMLTREMPNLKTPIKSDVAPLNGLIQHVLESGATIRFMRDVTRAGLSGLTADLAMRYGRRVVLEEKAIPVRRETRHAAEMLGLDVLEVANEGKVVMVVAREDADRVLKLMREHPLGEHAAIIGHLAEQQDGICELRTVAGGSRIVQKPYGEQLPRIC